MSPDEEIRLPLPCNRDPDRDGEIRHYDEIAFPSAAAESEGVSYVRFLRDGVEVMYYDAEEWERDPKQVMGAIMAILTHGPDDMRKTCDGDGCVAGIRRHVFTGCPGLPEVCPGLPEEVVERCGECDLYESDEVVCRRVAFEHGLVPKRVECDLGHEHWVAVREETHFRGHGCGLPECDQDYG